MTLRPRLLVPLAALLLGVLAPPARAQFGSERTGTAGFQFLKIPVDARSAALGEAVAATADDASALFWNPALAARATEGGRGLAAGLATTRYHADIAMHYGAGIARVRTPIGRLHLGLHLQALDGGEMDVTTELQPFGNGQTFGYAETAVGLTLSQNLTDLFAYGVTAKYVRLATADVAASTVVADLGVFYRVGETGAQIGVAIRNFGVADADPAGEARAITLDGDLEVITDFESITPPTQFLLGVAYDVLRPGREHALTLAGQLSNPNDNQERFNVGAEYTWSRTLVLRLGYQFGLEEGSTPSLGLGVHVPGFGERLRLDYGFNRRDVLGDIHRVGLNLTL